MKQAAPFGAALIGSDTVLGHVGRPVLRVPDRGGREGDEVDHVKCVIVCVESFPGVTTCVNLPPLSYQPGRRNRHHVTISTR